jgi:hypothetical protein
LSGDAAMYPVLKDVLAAPDDRKVRDGGKERKTEKEREKERERERERETKGGTESERERALGKEGGTKRGRGRGREGGGRNEVRERIHLTLVLASERFGHVRLGLV